MHKRSFNPFPPPIPLEGIEISDRSLRPPWAATDRGCGTVGRVRVGTNYIRPTSATARRPTDHQRLGSAPKDRPVEHPYGDGVWRRKRRAFAVEPERETNRLSRHSPELAPISVVMSVVTVYTYVS